MNQGERKLNPQSVIFTLVFQYPIEKTITHKTNESALKPLLDLPVLKGEDLVSAS